jgi:hypothetical protein
VTEDTEKPIVAGDLVECIETGIAGRVRTIFAVIITDPEKGTGIVRDRPSMRRKAVS